MNHFICQVRHNSRLYGSRTIPSVAPGLSKTPRWCTRWSCSVAASEEGTNTRGSLKGLRDLDMSRVLAALLCTQILADYSAEIVKVEAIGKGITNKDDDTRHWRMEGGGPTWKKAAGPISSYFSSINHNKKSITLDIKNAKGKEILIELAKRADVLVENFKPGTMDRLGLGYDTLKKHNPQLIYASISGYGTTGPYSSRGGYDPIAGAEAGLLHITGERNGPPVRPGIGMVDMATGLYLHGAILAALHTREQGGKGQRVDASLFETQISLLTNVGLTWLNLGIEAQRWGCQHPSIVPYDAFKTKDKYLVCGATNDFQFGSLCKLLGLESLITDKRFSTNPKRVENRDLIGPIFNDVFITKTADEWIELFKKTSLPFAPINNMENTFAHPQAEARGMVAQMQTGVAESGHTRIIGPAVKFSETASSLRTPPPTLGQHTVEVLGELGIDSQQVEALRQTGVV